MILRRGSHLDSPSARGQTEFIRWSGYQIKFTWTVVLASSFAWGPSRLKCKMCARNRPRILVRSFNAWKEPSLAQVKIRARRIICSLELNRKWFDYKTLVIARSFPSLHMKSEAINQFSYHSGVDKRGLLLLQQNNVSRVKESHHVVS